MHFYTGACVFKSPFPAHPPLVFYTTTFHRNTLFHRPPVFRCPFFHKTRSFMKSASVVFNALLANIALQHLSMEPKLWTTHLCPKMYRPLHQMPTYWENQQLLFQRESILKGFDVLFSCLCFFAFIYDVWGKDKNTLMISKDNHVRLEINCDYGFPHRHRPLCIFKINKRAGVVLYQHFCWHQVEKTDETN